MRTTESLSRLKEIEGFMGNPFCGARISVALATGIFILAGCAGGQQVGKKSEMTTDQQAGWRSLFDGKSLDQWRGIGRPDVPAEHWRVEDGTIHKIKSGNVPLAKDGQPAAGGDLMTKDEFLNFELAFEWKISPGGNSGVKYNVSEEMSTNNPLGASRAALGFEYQVLDDLKHPDARLGDGTNRTAAGLYDIFGPIANKPIKPAGEWNQARIVFNGNHGEHWLNGVKVLEYDLDSPTFLQAYARSKYLNIQGFKDRRSGHIVLQDHNDDAWYRNIRIREIK